jgi:hypothetical protein
MDMAGVWLSGFKGPSRGPESPARAGHGRPVADGALLAANVEAGAGLRFAE